MGLVLQRIRLVFQILIRLKDQTNALKDQTNPLKDQTHEIMNLQNRHAFGAETTKSSIIKDEPSSSHFSFV